MSFAVSGSDQYDYPELSVTPRASDRLETEANRESERRWGALLPMQISAFSTLTAGVIAAVSPTTPESRSANIGYIGVGAGGVNLLISSILMLSYQPYTSANRAISPLSKKTVREQLTKERAAEEEIAGIARLGKKLKWFSVITNLGASSVIMANLPKNSDGSSNVTAQAIDGVALAFSFLPILFPSYWQDVADEQNEYKKRIYAPVARGGILLDSGTQTYIPSLLVSFHF